MRVAMEMRMMVEVGGGVSVDVMEVNAIIQRSLRCEPETAEQSSSRCPKDRRIVDALTVVVKEW